MLIVHVLCKLCVTGQIENEKHIIYLSIYLSHSLGDRWGTTRPGNQHSPFLSFLCSLHGVAPFQTRPMPGVIFPSFSLSASPSPSPYSALEDCLGKSRSSCDMPILLRDVRKPC